MLLKNKDAAAAGWQVSFNESAKTWEMRTFASSVHKNFKHCNETNPPDLCRAIGATGAEVDKFRELEQVLVVYYFYYIFSHL